MAHGQMIHRFDSDGATELELPYDCSTTKKQCLCRYNCEVVNVNVNVMDAVLHSLYYSKTNCGYFLML